MNQRPDAHQPDTDHHRATWVGWPRSPRAPRSLRPLAPSPPRPLVRVPSLLLILLILLLTLTGCALALPDLAGRPPARLAYVNPDGLIATMPLGGQPALVTPAEPGDANSLTRRRYAWPTWSPDGRRLAYLAIDGGGASGAIFIAEPNGANRVTIQELTAGYPIYLSWSPDGATLAMLVTGDDTLRLLVGDSTGRGQARGLGNGQPLYSSWSPDSRSLLVHTGGAFSPTGLSRLLVVPTDPATPPEPIDLDPEPFRAPAWSPTGRHQALAGDNGLGEPALFLRDRDGTLRRFADLTGPPAMIWSPTGDQLAWSSFDGPPFGYAGLWLATADGRTRRRLTDDLLIAFFWSPTGDQIAYLTIAEGEQTLVLHVLPTNGGAARTLATFQPSNQFIQLVMHFDQYAQSASIWSADGRTLVFAGWPADAQPDDPSWLYTVSAAGDAPPQALTPGKIAFFAPEPPARR